MSKRKDERKKAARRAAARAGGLALVAKRGTEWMRIIGRRGFEVTCQRHFQGDKAKFVRFLVAMADPIPANGAFQDAETVLHPSVRARLANWIALVRSANGQK